MPSVVPAWLAGNYDNDKSVSRATKESFKQVFPAEDKYNNIWRIYRASILEYARDAIVKETVHTLSDERTTSPDDASAKYSRTIGAVIMVITHSIGAYPELDCR